MPQTLPSQAELDAAGLRLDIDGPIARITLAKPDRKNCQTPRMWRTLAAIGNGLPEQVWVVLLRAEGQSFSAGMDTAMLTPAGPEGEGGFTQLLAGTDEQVIAEIGEFQQGFVWLQRPDLITVAAVQGYAIGAGFQLALQCDIRVVADDVRFCMKEPALGLVPDLAGTKPLVDAVGYARALEICATARFVESAEAVSIGLATAAVPAEELADAVEVLLASITANPRAAVLATKVLLQAAGPRDLDAQRLAERTAQVGRLRELAAMLSQT